MRVWDTTSNKWMLSILVPTDTLRNATSGNQVKFYIYGAYNNNPGDSHLANGQYGVFSPQMTIDIRCGGEAVHVD